MHSQSTVEVMINASSGATDKEEACRRLSDIFGSSGRVARITLARSGSELAACARRAARGPAQTIVAGGGDGTINAVASAVADTGKALGVLPLGTFNYFARNLRIPLDLEGAARNLIEGHAVPVDVGEINGRLFLNNSSLGLYPSILREREQVYRRWGRSEWAAYLSVALTVARPRHLLNVRLSTDGKVLARRTPLVFVGSNEYQMESFNLPGRACLDAGELALYLVHPTGRLGLLHLALRTLLRRLRPAEDFQMWCAKEVWVETRRKRLRVALDGEVAVMETPLHYRLLPGALRVIVPGRDGAGSE